jgi:hypothetical protein
MSEHIIEESEDRIALYELWDHIVDDLICSAGPAILMAVMANVFYKRSQHAQESGCKTHEDLYKYMGDKCTDMSAVFHRTLEEHEHDHNEADSDEFFL